MKHTTYQRYDLKRWERFVPSVGSAEKFFADAGHCLYFCNPLIAPSSSSVFHELSPIGRYGLELVHVGIRGIYAVGTSVFSHRGTAVAR